MRRFTIMFVVLAWLAIPLHVHAKELRGDGNELLEYCTDDESEALGLLRTGRCIGYLSGFIDAMILFELPHCMPKEITQGQVKMIVVKYLQDYPARLHYQMAVLVEAALIKAFPCKASPSPQ